MSGKPVGRTTIESVPAGTLSEVWLCAAAQRFFLWRFALMRLRYLCLLIFLRRFFTNEPMESFTSKRWIRRILAGAAANRKPGSRVEHSMARARPTEQHNGPALFGVLEEPFDLGDELFTVSRAYLLRPPATAALLQPAHVIEKI